MLRIVFIVFAVTYFFTRSSLAQTSFYGIHQQYMSTRAMGMGNAGIAISDDESATFYNPAGLPQLTESKWNLFIKGGADPKILDLMDDIDKAGNDNQALAEAIESKYGKTYSLRAPSLGILYANRKWGIAFIPADVSAFVKPQAGLGPVINLNAYQDSTLAFSRAWSLRNVSRGKVDIGFTSKFIYRAHLEKVITVPDLMADNNILAKEDSNEGLTFDLDFAAMYHMPEYSSGFLHYMQPSFGLVVRNALDYGYFANFGLYADDKQGDPEKLRRRVDVGSAFTMPKWSIWTTRWAFDIRDIAHPNWTLRKGLHAGVEFLWEMNRHWKGGWRAGVNQGYWTAGFTGQLWVLKLDLATMGQEMGTESVKEESRLYMFTASIDF